jgi:hypothetical protein
VAGRGILKDKAKHRERGGNKTHDHSPWVRAHDAD